MKKGLFWFIIILFMIIFHIFYSLFHFNYEKSFLFSFIIYFLLLVFINIITNLILVKSINNFNAEKDPQKTLKVINFLEKITISETFMQVLLINKSAIIFDLGDYKGALKALSFEPIQKLNPIFKVQYYVNLSGCYIKLDDLNKGEQYLNKAENIYKDLKNNKYSNILKQFIVLNKTEIKVLKNEKDEELDNLIKEILIFKPINIRTEIVTNKILGKAYSLKGKDDKAKGCLKFVKSNSKKPHEIKELEDYILGN